MNMARLLQIALMCAMIEAGRASTSRLLVSNDWQSALLLLLLGGSS